MTNPPGSTRSVLKTNYAVLAPENFGPCSLPGWSDVTAHVVVSSAMGAACAQTLVTFHREGRGAGSTRATELFAYVVEGACSFAVPGTKARLAAGGFAFVSPSKHWEFTSAEEGTRLLLAENRGGPQNSNEAPSSNHSGKSLD